MSYQEKRNSVSILTIFFYARWVMLLYPEALSSGQDEVRFWASVILLFVPITIVAHVVVNIIFSIILAVTTREEEPPFTDELDALVQLKATRNACYAITIGLMVALASVVLGQTLTVMFVLFAAALIVGELIWDASTLYYYRRGVQGEQNHHRQPSA